MCECFADFVLVGTRLFFYGSDEVKLKLSNYDFSFCFCLLWHLVCGLAAKQSSVLRLTASLSHFLLAPSWLCSCSPQHPDHGKCIRPGHSRPQTEWPDKETRTTFTTRLPMAAVDLSLCSSRQKKARDVTSRSGAHVILNAWLKWENTHSTWLVSTASTTRRWELVFAEAWWVSVRAWDNWRRIERNHDVNVLF